MSHSGPIKIAILAMGSKGGSASTGWLAHAAHLAGYLVQTAFVPGAGQGGGATVYYAELFPRDEAEKRGKPPILGLVPTPGDVDIVIASDLVEAGRAIERGLVTPDRTTLIASTHRVYAMAGKMALADGPVDSEALIGACRRSSMKFVGFDMAAAAESSKSVIGAVLLGALAGSGALPIPASHFEEAISDGEAASSSLAAFRAGLAGAQQNPAPGSPATVPLPAAILPSVLAEEVRRYACGEAQPLILAGLERCADYQDVEYAALYWRRLLPFVTLAQTGGRDEGELLAAAARQLALGMTYPDLIRVAELKLRASRFAQIRKELGAEDSQILEVVEYIHPRPEDILDTMPSRIGRRLFESSIGKALLRKLTDRSRVVRSTSVRGYLMLYMVASLKRWRRRSLRYVRETEFLGEWLDTVWGAAKHDLRLATAIASARGLLKSYGEAYERGFKKFEMICEFVRNNHFRVSGEDIRQLVEKAQSEDGTAALEAAMTKLKCAPPLRKVRCYSGK